MITRSCVVRSADFRDLWFSQRTRELHENWAKHRKLWEYCVIAQVYHERIGFGGSVLGFGIGREPLAAWFAAQVAQVVATDRPDQTAAWTSTAQHAASLEELRRDDVCPPEAFAARVQFRPLDMNLIPDDLMRGQFDMTWSSGSFEHLGSLAHGLAFFCRQMACLKPGGLAVHTTEYNPRDVWRTLDAPELALYRSSDLQALGQRLLAQGDTLWPLDLVTGDEPADRHIDREPYGLPHLTIAVGPFVTTSVLLVAEKGRV